MVLNIVSFGKLSHKTCASWSGSATRGGALQHVTAGVLPLVRVFATMDQREACDVGKNDAITRAAGKHEFWVRFFRSGFDLRHVNRTQPEG